MHARQPHAHTQSQHALPSPNVARAGPTHPQPMSRSKPPTQLPVRTLPTLIGVTLFTTCVVLSCPCHAVLLADSAAHND